MNYIAATGELAQRVDALGTWYHRIDLGGGIITPGDRDQSLTYNLYKGLIPDDLSGMTVLDVGARAVFDRYESKGDSHQA